MCPYLDSSPLFVLLIYFCSLIYIFGEGFDYNLTIWFKDGRFKYQITIFRAFQGSPSPHNEQWMQARYSDPDIAMERFSKLNIEIEKLVENMTSNLSNNKQKDDDDW